MIWVRIYSSMIDDGDHQPDKKEVVVILTRLKDNYEIDTDVQGFGYVQEWTDESESYQKYPFVFDVLKNKKGMARLNYEGWDPKEILEVNIASKEIREKEVFTLFSGEKEYTYRIDRVSVL